jgi:hypothetical protein
MHLMNACPIVKIYNNLYIVDINKIKENLFFLMLLHVFINLYI